MNTKTTAWVAGAVVAATAIAAAAWFVAINPTFGQAATQRQAAADQRDHNDLLRMQIDRLKADYAHLDEYKAQLADLRTKVPTTGDLAELTRQIQTLADTSGVTITDMSPSIPVVVAPAAAPQPAPTESSDGTATGSDSTNSSAGATDGSTAAATETGLDGFYTIQLQLTSVGTYQQTITFLDSLQQSMARLYVVYRVDAQSLDESGASGGRPATKQGDLETNIAGVVLTLEDPQSAAPQPSATDTPEPQLPVPADQRNPFQHVGS